MARTVSIRRSLLRTLLLLIGLLGAGALAATLLASRRTADALADATMRASLDASVARLDGFFGVVARELEILRDWGQAGLLPLDDPETMRAMLQPLLRRHPQITGAIIAQDSGHEYLLERAGRVWRERRITQTPSGGRAEWREWTRWSDSPEPRVEETDYDPRERPWFRGATATPDQTHWTAPYTFFESKVPGVTAATTLRDPKGTPLVVAFDVPLAQISEFTLKLAPSARGVGFAASRDGRLVGLPRDARFENAASRRAAMLQRPEALGIPLLADAAAAWEERDMPLGLPFRFESEAETWWGQMQPYAPGGAALLRVGVVVPEADLVGRLDRVLLGIAGLTLVFLGLATLRALALARRVSAPIEALSHNSDRIALGDLTAGEPILSPIREVERLVGSQERMREALGTLMKLGRDLELAREIQQQTLPETLPELEGMAIAAWSEPAEQTGGDSYDVIGFDRLEAGRARRLTQGPARHALCLLADATGHGVGPALSVTQVRSMLRMALRAGVEQRWALRHMSLQLARDLPPGRFVTAWLGVLDADEKTLAGFSAGQAPLYLYRASGGSIEELAANAPPLGLLEEEDLELPEPFVLEPGDLFAVFSDGIFDRENPGGDTFGEARVRDLLVREAPRGVDRVLEALRRALADFAAGTPSRDDQTALLIQREA